MKTQSNSAISILLRAITESTVSLAVQVATLRVVETLARLCSSGLVSDMRQLRENILVRDSASATIELADARIKVAEAVQAENKAVEAQRHTLAENRRLEAEADAAAILAKREADIAEATETLKAAIHRLQTSGGAVFYEPEGVDQKQEQNLNIEHTRERPQLTGRELQVAAWIAQGKTNWEIARIVGLTERTVRFDIESMMLKMNVTTRGLLISKLHEHGLIPPDPTSPPT